MSPGILPHVLRTVNGVCFIRDAFCEVQTFSYGGAEDNAILLDPALAAKSYDGIPFAMPMLRDFARPSAYFARAVFVKQNRR